MYAEQLELLANLTKWLFVVILSVAAVLIIWQVTTSRINLSGLMIDKSNGEFSPGRLQLLLFTFLVAISYILAVTGHGIPGGLIEASEKPGQLPDVGKWVIGILSGSSASYLGGKSAPTLGRMIAVMTGRTI